MMLHVALELILADYYTELFDDQDNDLSNISLVFTPDGSSSFYQLCTKSSTEFPTDPCGSTPISLADDDYEELILTGGSEVSFYGQSYPSLFVGSNGYITFQTGD